MIWANSASKCYRNKNKSRRRPQKKPWKIADFKTSISWPSGLRSGRFFFSNWVFFWEELRYTTLFCKFCTEIYWKFLECRGSLLRKKISAKIKSSCPQLRPRKVLWYHLLRTQTRSKNIITTNNEYTIDPQSNIEEQYAKKFYYYQTLEVGQHHTMDPIMEGILSCSLASSRGHPPIELPLHNKIFLFMSHYIAWAPLYSATIT